MLSGRKTSRLVLWIALVGLLTIGIIAPIGFFYISYEYLAGSLDSEARLQAGVITGIISSNPETWELEQERLREILSHRIDRRYPETRRILNLKREVVAESTGSLGFPVMERSFDLMDSGVVAGTIEVQRSMRPLLLQTLLVGAVSVSLGIVAFLLIRVLPVRALERKEEDLRVSEEKLRSLVTAIEERHFMYQHDRDGVFTYLSPSIATILGYSPEEFMMNYAACLTDHPVNESVKEFKERGLRGEAQPPYELEIYHIDGRRIRLEMAERPLIDGKGQVSGLQGIAQDISDRKKAQEMRLVNIQVETMRKFIRGLSHEIRNPLFGISSVSQILDREIKDEKYLPMIRSLNDESNRITRLIKELNMYVTTKTPDISQIDLESFIHKVKHKCAGKHPQANFRVALEPSVTLKGDEALLAFAIEELLNNSCEAGSTEIVIDIYLAEEQVNLSIWDNGKGMSEKELLECCETFYTTKQGSSGLGLPLCRKVIEMHGGRFDITSRVGEGTYISISI
jgi:PAS domain S-box-containing protein